MYMTDTFYSFTRHVIFKSCFLLSVYHCIVEPHYNKVLGTTTITLLYEVSHYIRVKKQRNIKSWDQQDYLVIRGFCYIRPLYNEVPLYSSIVVIIFSKIMMEYMYALYNNYIILCCKDMHVFHHYVGLLI